MKRLQKFLLLALFSVSVATLLSSCEKGPAEKLGEKIDNGVQNTKDAARDAADDLKKKN